MKPAALLASACLLGCGGAAADDARARFNYMIHCQGCHLPEAVGVPGNVPRMKDFVGYFLHSEEGREFVIRVPGVATSSLSNAELAELVNWILTTYSAAELPDGFVPYSEEEVAAQRLNLEGDPESRRVEILERLKATRPALAAKLDSGEY